MRIGNGKWLYDQEGFAGATNDFYTKQFTMQIARGDYEMLNEILQVVSGDKNEELQEMPMKEEVRSAVMGLNQHSVWARWNDRGFNQSVWEIIGDDIHKMYYEDDQYPMQKYKEILGQKGNKEKSAIYLHHSVHGGDLVVAEMCKFKIPMDDMLRRWGMEGPSRCWCCDKPDHETMSHVIQVKWEYPPTRSIKYNTNVASKGNQEIVRMHIVSGMRKEILYMKNESG
ncbi:hypothetical protein H5410_005820 [Solanum commersonii]|uniref:Reverse transcriptase zinc-binding domain-containing protein n=1 Tax=Solanum commersonii TaxID=4109 RepID=A0A9J6A8H6_SOLCO|nr:hypothetical protein H5410_005820 [Solanum commersonii]